MKGSIKVTTNWRGIVLLNVIVICAAAAYSLWTYVTVLDLGERVQRIEDKSYVEAEF